MIEDDVAALSAFALEKPQPARNPYIFASPHSGRYYPKSLLRASALDPLTLRRSEDAFIDELFAAAPDLGSCLFKATFARVYLDMNREPLELDPTMFVDRLPSHANTTSTRVVGGLGTIAKVVSDGAEVYRGKLTYAEAEERLQRLYYPYHNALQQLTLETRAHFGHTVLIDCHSMPSIGPKTHGRGMGPRADVILGDRFGTSCAPELVDFVHDLFRDMGYSVARNNPYAGGFTTHHYGRPSEQCHALQIELNRGLYMDEARICRNGHFAQTQSDITQFISRLCAYDVA